MRVHSAITISQTDGKAMYLQIFEQIRHKIAVGDWQAGAEIPSIRQLAADLSVSVITVKRAYLELERIGAIVTLHGRGSIVSASTALSTAAWDQQLSLTLAEAARLARMLDLAPAALQARLEAAIKQDKDDH
jgi:GntR family transcriptional regulator